MDENIGWLGRFLQLFGPLVAAWSAFLAYLVHLKKIRNAEKAAAHGRILEEIDRLLGEIDRLRSERDVKIEECDMVRDKLAERDAEKVELMGENAKLKGVLQGYGEWREAEALRDAARRQRERDRAGNGGGE